MLLIRFEQASRGGGGSSGMGTRPPRRTPEPLDVCGRGLIPDGGGHVLDREPRLQGVLTAAVGDKATTARHLK